MSLIFYVCEDVESNTLFEQFYHARYQISMLISWLRTKGCSIQVLFLVAVVYIIKLCYIHICTVWSNKLFWNWNWNFEIWVAWVGLFQAWLDCFTLLKRRFTLSECFFLIIRLYGTNHSKLLSQHKHCSRNWIWKCRQQNVGHFYSALMLLSAVHISHVFHIPRVNKVCVIRAIRGFHEQHGKSEGFHSCDRPSNLTKIGFKSYIFQPVWPWNLMDDLKKIYRTPLLHYIKLCALSQTLGEFKLELQSGNAKFGSKSAIFCPVWPCNLMDDLAKL